MKKVGLVVLSSGTRSLDPLQLLQNRGEQIGTHGCPPSISNFNWSGVVTKPTAYMYLPTVP